MNKFDELVEEFFTPARERRWFVIAALLCFAFFGELAWLVHTGKTIAADNAFHSFFLAWQDAYGPMAWQVATWFGNAYVVAVAAVIAVSWLCKKGRFAAAAFFGTSIVGGALLGYAFKALIASARPDNFVSWLDSNYSFPSGHTIVAFTGYLAGLLLFRSDIARLANPWRAAVIGAFSLLIVTLPLSRLVLGVHWLSDVLGGMLLGGGWALFVFAFYRRRWQIKN